MSVILDSIEVLKSPVASRYHHASRRDVPFNYKQCNPKVWSWYKEEKHCRWWEYQQVFLDKQPGSTTLAVNSWYGFTFRKCRPKLHRQNISSPKISILGIHDLSASDNNSRPKEWNHHSCGNQWKSNDNGQQLQKSEVTWCYN